MISSSYLMLIVATLVIGMGAQWYVNHKLKTYSHVANSTGLTGAEAARQIPPLGLIAAGDGHDVGTAQGGQIQHGEGAHRPQALHHRHLGLL